MALLEVAVVRMKEIIKDVTWVLTVVAALGLVLVMTISVVDWLLEAIWG